MKKKVVLVDMDGVLADIIEKIVGKVNAKFETSYFPKDVTDWKFSCMSSIEKSWVLDNLFLQDFFFRALPKVPGGIETVSDWIVNEKFEVFFVTSPEERNPSCYYEKWAWLRAAFSEEIFEAYNFRYRVIFTKDKTAVKGDYLIDDKPEVKGAFTPEWKHLCFEAPYNTHIKNRVNWKNVEKFIV